MWLLLNDLSSGQTGGGLTVVGTQGPCRDAVGPHPYRMVSTGPVHHSCLPRLFQQLCQSPGGKKGRRNQDKEF